MESFLQLLLSEEARDITDIPTIYTMVISSVKSPVLQSEIAKEFITLCIARSHYQKAHASTQTYIAEKKHLTPAIAEGLSVFAAIAYETLYPQKDEAFRKGALAILQLAVANINDKREDIQADYAKLLETVPYQRDLDPADIEELQDICERFIDYVAKTFTSEDKDEYTLDDLRAVVKKKQMDAYADMTAFEATTVRSLPTAEVFWKQREIAQRMGQEIAFKVDRQGTVIMASIGSASGEEIKLSPFEIGIEAAIGRMKQRAKGYINVTAQQVYREYRGLDPNASVSEGDRVRTAAAIKKLMNAPATLDFTQQIERHTKLKRKADANYDYTKFTGHLITGMVYEHGTGNGTGLKYRGKIIDEYFTIYELPMYYSYAYMVGQIGNYPKVAFLGREDAVINEDAKISSKARTSVRPKSDVDIAMRDYILRQISAMSRRYREHNNRINNDRSLTREEARKKMNETYSENMVIANIAEQCGAPYSEKQTMRAFRNLLNVYLKEISEQDQPLIQGYEMLKEHGVIKRVRIDLKTNNTSITEQE